MNIVLITILEIQQSSKRAKSTLEKMSLIISALFFIACLYIVKVMY